MQAFKLDLAVQCAYRYIPGYSTLLNYALQVMTVKLRLLLVVIY